MSTLCSGGHATSAWSTARSIYTFLYIHFVLSDKHWCSFQRLNVAMEFSVLWFHSYIRWVMISCDIWPEMLLVWVDFFCWYLRNFFVQVWHLAKVWCGMTGNWHWNWNCCTNSHWNRHKQIIVITEPMQFCYYIVWIICINVSEKQKSNIILSQKLGFELTKLFLQKRWSTKRSLRGVIISLHKSIEKFELGLICMWENFKGFMLAKAYRNTVPTGLWNRHSHVAVAAVPIVNIAQQSWRDRII